MMQVKQVQKWGWLLFLLGACFVLVWDWLAEPGRPSTVPAMTAPIIEQDINQHRLNAVPPAPKGSWIIQQAFVPLHDGLREVELILARNGDPDPEEDGRFTITLFDEQGQIITEQSLESRTISHNHTYNLTFSPQSHSQGQLYHLQLSGNVTNPLTAWGYDLNVYDEGDLQLLPTDDNTIPETTAVDLRFVTRYQLGWVEALSTAVAMIWREGAIILLTLLFLPLPGLFLMRLRPLHWRGWDVMAWLGTVLVLGTAVWPLLWYGFSLIGGRWSGWLLWLVVLVGWIVFVVLQLHKPAGLPGGSGQSRLPSFRWRSEHSFLLILLFVGLVVRLLAVRDLAAPPWVDAARHVLITAVMVENGRTISDYAPFLPDVVRFPYHFGFHTISASLALMSGWQLPRLLLVLGQVLNALVPLAVYTAVWLMSRRRKASVFAAFLVALPFFFPAYYATWGRFTQLTAMFIMPVLAAFTWLLLRGAKRWKSGWWIVTILAAAMFLVHFRVFLFYVPFAALVWSVSLGRHGRWLLLSGITSFLLILPRLTTLISITEPVQSLSRNITNYNDFPFNYYNAAWDRFFIWLAALLVIFMIAAFIRRKTWTMLPLTLVLWVWLLFILLAGDYLGLPSSSLVNINSMYITLFFPLAVFLGVVLDQIWRWLKHSHWILLSLGYVLVGSLLTAVTLFGIQQQTNILNDQTILVQPADLPALAWLDENLAEDAFLAVSSWKWLGEAWAGSDGGSWIVPLTARSSSTPPADYTYSRELFEQVNGFNEVATAVTDWSAPETAVWLQEQGITHLFVGARGGFFDPAALAKNPNIQIIYAQDGTFIFEIDQSKIE